MEHTCEYVEAMLGLEVWANNLYQAVLAPANAGHDGHQHDWAPVVPARRLQRAGTQHTRKIGMLTAAGACSPAAPTAGPDARS